ncbi:MAG: asparaginase, partial [Actinomycetota bacterium]|nr:asparaginase [Actinomycetota bacterium]
EVFTAMHRYPALIAANGEGDTEIAVATNSVAKGGAAGCLGIALDSGIGIAVKSWDGRGDIANTGGVAALESIGALSATALTALSDVGSPPVFGGGRVVGVIEPRLDLEFA